MGDFGAKFHRQSSGVHTIEGNLSGIRAANLTKQRVHDQQLYEKRKRKIQLDSLKTCQNITKKFNSNDHLSLAEQTFKEKTVGLVSAKDFRKAAIESRELERRVAGGKEKNTSVDDDHLKKIEKEKNWDKQKKIRMLNTLSFTVDGDISLSNVYPDGQEITCSMMKDPDADTSFLPDQKREEALNLRRLQLKEKWLLQQTKRRREKLEITYSYWDGSGHRRRVICRVGDTIGRFLDHARKDLAEQFREMQNVSSDALLYIKEDLMIPHDITFYDLIVTKARGKSGPLFHFDVHHDIRVGTVDTRIEKDESHPGKIVERRWYERNKHIFPASRWELFEYGKDYGQYTIRGDRY